MAALTRMWATYLQSHGDVSDMPFQVGGVTVPGNSRTRGAVPATDIAAAIDDLTANGRAPALCAFRVKVPERVARLAAGQAQATLWQVEETQAPGAVLAEDLWFDLLEIDHATADGGNADLDYLPLLASVQDDMASMAHGGFQAGRDKGNSLCVRRGMRSALCISGLWRGSHF